MTGTLLRTIGGQGCGASIDGVGTNANFRFPFSLAVSTSGIVYVGDYAAIREIDTAGGCMLHYKLPTLNNFMKMTFEQVQLQRMLEPRTPSGVRMGR